MKFSDNFENCVLNNDYNENKMDIDGQPNPPNLIQNKRNRDEKN